MAQRIEVARAGRTRVPEAASVLLTVPAHKDYIVIVRSAVAQLGTCFGFTVGEIGEEIGVSQMRVSRLLTRILGRLRGGLGVPDSTPL